MPAKPVKHGVAPFTPPASSSPPLFTSPVASSQTEVQSSGGHLAALLQHFLWSLLGMGVIMLLLIPFLSPRTTVFIGDEYTMLYDAQRILEGQVPYRDYFNFPTPGTFYLLALLFRLCGTSMLVGRLATFFTLAVTTLLLYHITRPLVKRRWLAAAPGIFLTGILFPDWALMSHHWYSLLFVTLTLWSGLRYLAHNQLRFLWLGGLAGSVSFLFVQNEGLLALLALGGILFLHLLQTRKKEQLAQSLRSFSREVGAVLGGAVPPVLGFACYFYSQGALRQAIVATLLWPFTNHDHSQGVNDVAFGFIATVSPIPLVDSLHRLTFSIAMLLPLVALLWSIALLIRDERPQSSLLQARQAVTLFAATTALSVFVGKPDTLHIGFATFPCFVLLSILLDPASLPGQENPAPTSVTSWGLRAPPALIARAALGVFLAIGLASVVARVATQGVGLDDIRHGDQVVASQTASAFILAHTNPGDRVVALPYGGATYLYSRPSAIKYTHMVPLMAHYNSSAELEDAARDIERLHPKFIVIERTIFNFYHWYSAPDDPLAAYLRTAYTKREPLRNADIYEYDGGSIQVATHFTLGTAIRLEGYSIANEAGKPGSIFHPGDTLNLTLFWKAQSTPSRAATVFVHLVDDQGHTWAQQDNPPVGGSYPTTAWWSGEIIRDHYRLALPQAMPAGSYHLEVGMYTRPDLQRLAVFDEQRKPSPTIRLGPVGVLRRAA